ncbi:MAG: GHMP kinase, partial [Armatimonadota bacterium]|nr:GHMP kinase [Armatimonadota bacterium]
TPRHEVMDLVDRLPEPSATKLKANLINRDITIEAMALFKGKPDPKKLGELLTKHHEQLRNGIRVSTPKIDSMLQAAIEAGALGGKINGSGGGGCMFAYAPGREKEVVEALERAGGKAYILTIDQGARLEWAL